MSALLAFFAAFIVTYIGVGYLTLRVCFWIADRSDRD